MLFPDDYPEYRRASISVSCKLRKSRSNYKNHLGDGRSNKQFDKYIKKALDSKINRLTVANNFASEFAANFTDETLANIPELPGHTRNR